MVEARKTPANVQAKPKVRRPAPRRTPGAAEVSQDTVVVITSTDTLHAPGGQIGSVARGHLTVHRSSSDVTPVIIVPITNLVAAYETPVTRAITVDTKALQEAIVKQCEDMIANQTTCKAPGCGHSMIVHGSAGCGAWQQTSGANAILSGPPTPTNPRTASARRAKTTASAGAARAGLATPHSEDPLVAPGAPLITVPAIDPSLLPAIPGGLALAPGTTITAGIGLHQAKGEPGAPSQPVDREKPASPPASVVTGCPCRTTGPLSLIAAIRGE